jgi:hypothetical protein
MGPAQPEPGASYLSVMPPKSMRLFEGPMEKGNSKRLRRRMAGTLCQPAPQASNGRHSLPASASGVEWQALFECLKKTHTHTHTRTHTFTSFSTRAGEREREFGGEGGKGGKRERERGLSQRETESLERHSLTGGPGRRLELEACKYDQDPTGSRAPDAPRGRTILMVVRD